MENNIPKTQNLVKRLAIPFIIVIMFLIGWAIFGLNKSTFKDQNTNQTSTTPTIQPSNTSTVQATSTTQPSATATATPAPGSTYKTFTENTQKWSIQYPDNWTPSKQTETKAQNPAQSYYELFISSNTESTSTNHKGLFSVKQLGGGMIGTYEDCVNESNSGGGGAAAGHTATVPVKFTFNGYNACKYTETATDGIVRYVNNYTFIKDPNTGRIASISYAEDNNSSPQHNYDQKDWVYSNIFDKMEKSFKFI